MKTLIASLLGILCLVSSASAQYAASASGSTTAAAEINSKPAFQVAADPTALALLNGTAGKDFAFVTSTGKSYMCQATGTPCTAWTQIESAMTFSTGLSRSGGGAVTCVTANGSTLGCISAADWTTFNAKVTNPLTTAGDIFIGGASGVPARLAAGALDTALHGNGAGTAPSYAAITNCGDATHALAYSTSSHSYSCQAITGSAAAGGSSGDIQYNNAGALGGAPIANCVATGGVLQYTSSTHTFSCHTLGSADIPNNAANTSGTAALATALAANGTNCSAGTHPLGVDASGNAESCTADAGASVFTGSTASTSSFSATPTFSLADVSVKSPTRFEPAALTGNVTSVTFTNKTAGAKFSIAWLQDGTGSRTVTYGSASNTCAIAPTASITTTQFFEIAADGSTVVGVGCSSNESAERIPLVSALGTPASGIVCWADSTDLTRECKDTAGVVYKMVKTGVDINPVTGQVTATHLAAGLPRNQGGLNSTSAGAGLLRDGTTPAASELSGDATTSGSNVVTVVKLNSASLPASAPLVGTNSSSQIVLATPFMTNAQTATYQVLAADFSNYKTIIVASGTFTITLVASGTQPPTGQFVRVVNYGSGVVTIARSGQNINGGTGSLTLPAGSATAPTAAFVVSDATNYFALLSGSNATQVGGVTITGTPSVGYVPTATSGTAATWQAAAGGGTVTDNIFLPLAAEYNPSGTATAIPSASAEQPATNFPVPNNFAAPTWGKDSLLFSHNGGVDSSTYIKYRLHDAWTGTLTLVLHTYGNSAGTAAVMSVQTACATPGTTVLSSLSYNTATSVTHTYIGTTYLEEDLTFSTVDVTGCSAGQPISIKLNRIGSSGSDTAQAVYAVGLTLKMAHN